MYGCAVLSASILFKTLEFVSKVLCTYKKVFFMFRDWRNTYGCCTVHINFEIIRNAFPSWNGRLVDFVSLGFSVSNKR
jgi:hypothetical protein